VWLQHFSGLSNKKLIEFYSEKSLCLKCSRTWSICGHLATDGDGLVMAAHLCRTRPWALCFWEFQHAHPLLQGVKGTVHELGTCKRALSPTWDDLDNSLVFKRFVRMAQVPCDKSVFIKFLSSVLLKKQILSE
jgi:hypothetical protein